MTTALTALTKEELAELAELEKNEQARITESAHAAQRQHLDALRATKRLAGKYGTPGRDFVVLETTVGNIAIRRPLDLEVDAVAAQSDSREEQEKFLFAVAVEPPREELAKLMADFPGIPNAVIPRAFALIGKLREEEAKK